MRNRQSPHGDYDHVGEAVDLINNFEINRVYFNEGDFGGNETKIMVLLQKKNTNYQLMLIQLLKI